MSYVSVHGNLELSDREHIWTDKDGTVWSIVDLGAVDIAFDSAGDARAVAARCVKAAEAMDALAAEGAPVKEAGNG